MYYNEKVNFYFECKDYVKKVKVKINLVQQSRFLLSQVYVDAVKENICYCGAVVKRLEKKGTEFFQGYVILVLFFKEIQEFLFSFLFQEGFGVIVVGESSSFFVSISVLDLFQKKEEYNYFFFVFDNLGEQLIKCSFEEDEEDEEDVDDEDYDEGFGSEYEFFENEEEEEEEEDYEDDKDDDISDIFFELGIVMFGGLLN